MQTPMEDLERRRDAAEREVRRGNFRTALDAYEALIRDFPDDPRLTDRLATLRELLQPMELVHPKATGATAGGGELTDVQAGESAANRGDFIGAVAAYERAVAADPGNELLRERLLELQGMAGAQNQDWTSSPPAADDWGDATADGAGSPAAGGGGQSVEGGEGSAGWADGPQITAGALSSADSWAAAAGPAPETASVIEAATPGPISAPPPPAPERGSLPDDPVGLLELLLERVRTRRRVA